jgi:hypothetical protein
MDGKKTNKQKKNNNNKKGCAKKKKKIATYRKLIKQIEKRSLVLDKILIVEGSQLCN